MIDVLEQVFKDDGSLEYETKGEFPNKSQFLKMFGKLDGVTGQTLYELGKNGEATFTIDGVKRKVEIKPRIILEIAK